MTDIERLAVWLGESGRIVFFGGAGVSTESGIPDFRSTDGLYRQKWKYPPETILSHSFFLEHTEEFFDFYREKMLFPGAKPNAAHKALARLEAQGRLSCVITQNIDGLHQAAGSRRVYELHGSVHRNTCLRCGKKYTLADVLQTQGVPRCACGGVIKPDVVLYEEGLDSGVIEDSCEAIANADLLLIGGTSLTVYPAAAFVQGYRGRLAILNKTPTPMDARAGIVLAMPIGEALTQALAIKKTEQM